MNTPNTQVIKAKTEKKPEVAANPFMSADASMSVKQEQQMQQRFLQHFESMRFETAIEPDHQQWLDAPTHKHTFRFGVCERVAQDVRSPDPMDLVGRRAQDVWIGSQVDRGRVVLQRLGLEIIGKPRVLRDEMNPDRIALEYDVDLKEKTGPVKPHTSLPEIAKQLAEATSYYYKERKGAKEEFGVEYVEPEAITR